VLCLPTGLAVLWLWHRLVGPVLAGLLGSKAGGLTADWADPAPFGPPARFALVCASIVIGSFSHISWDAFTHEGGLVVNLWSGFSHRIGPGAVPVYRWLQYGSSLFGMSLLGVWAHRATQRPVPAPVVRSEGAESAGARGSVLALSRARRAVAAAVLGGLLLVGAVGAVQGAHRGSTFDVVKDGGAGAMAGALLSLVLSCAAVSRRRAGNP
jgi:hypothetical protein